MIFTTCQKYQKSIAWLLVFVFYGETVAANHALITLDRGLNNAGNTEHMTGAFMGTGLRSSFPNDPIRLLSPHPKKSPVKIRVSALHHRLQQNKKIYDIGGPSQPEMQSFQSVNNNNMVDLFSGDFSYNIPLMDVGGYPVNLSYRSGITMDQEASWTGLGWNVNPGAITRNLRGLPDDFDGTDSVRKITSIRENKTIGVTLGADAELVGLPIGIGASLGIFQNTYKGWGLEGGLNASINSGANNMGPFTAGLSLTNNSQEGLTISPSLSIKLMQYNAEETAGAGYNFSIGAPYNSRSGLKGLQLSAGYSAFRQSTKDQKSASYGNGISSMISFSSPSTMPTMTMPLSTSQFTFTAKVGLEYLSFRPDFYISGYITKQSIAKSDTLMTLPAYGYLYNQDGGKNPLALLDFNHEKEMVYRDKPALPHIAVPFYTYDAFSITGEGTGGMFRAYRGDIGFVHDHFMRTKDISGAASVDIGVGDLVHGGVDLNLTRSFTQNAAWTNENDLQPIISFKPNNGLFEGAYFRNPGEKAINTKSYYDSLGGDDVVAVNLFQSGSSSPSIVATSFLNRYHAKQVVGAIHLTAATATKAVRDKRSQVISYLTATEASTAGLSKYIENYALNRFDTACCTTGITDVPNSSGTGITGQYFPSKDLSLTPTLKLDYIIYNDWGKKSPVTSPPNFPSDNFTARWVGRVKAAQTGTYIFQVEYDDGCRLWINDTLQINAWHKGNPNTNNQSVNLVAGTFYTLRLEYYEVRGNAKMKLRWHLPSDATNVFNAIPEANLYMPEVDSINVPLNATSPRLVLEKRVNQFRKSNHLSEIDVLNPDGRRYVYGIPVYNFKQREATFAVSAKNGNINTGLVGYKNGVDNTATQNVHGKDRYFNSEEMPAYAHSFLLTGILSTDYVDLTGNGISDDDLGDAIRFNYSKVAGVHNPYLWRAPYVKDSVTFTEGLKTDSSDDKGNYVYGEKELWFLHTIESKNMIATFVVENRADLWKIDEAGNKILDSTAKRLKEIDLYSKSDFLKNGTKSIPIKTVHFSYSYELCTGVNAPLNTGGKLTLKKIWFSYNGNGNDSTRNPYIFHYHANNPSYTIRSYDRWGNYKDPSQNPGSTTSRPLTNAEYPYAIQDSTTAGYNASAWTMDSLILPSGGALKINYESDDYAYVQNLRAMQMFKLVGFSIKPADLAHAIDSLYSPKPAVPGFPDSVGPDNLYAYINVPTAVTSKVDVYQKYLTGITKLYFKAFVQMPSDKYGAGNEYVPCYADLDSGQYGMSSANVIWVKMKGISLAGDGDGQYSPVAKAAIQFLRLNLPSKAYPGSDIGDNLDLAAAVKMISGMTDNIKSAFSSFDKTARSQNWASIFDTSRTYVRLDNPNYKKYGGGQRVKQITIYDKWDKMTGSFGSSYGQSYIYTTTKQINGVMQTISSGVASYEPGLGGEENPFHQPIEYVEKISPLGPTTLGYSEEPLGESVFPSTGIGYSQVRVRTINYTNKRSANGYDETRFYTAYDFPTTTDRSMLDGNTKKRYKPTLANLLRINAKYYLTMSQGFKVELNDMHGKLRSQGSYPENDPNNPVTYTENFYKVVNPNVDAKTLTNTVTTIKPDGTVDTASLIGKDAELMIDMREQLSVTNAANVNINTDMFSLPFFPPLFLIPSFINLAQRQETRFRSAAVLKVIQRYGILDSVIHIDKGSIVSTKDLAYDAETGDVLVTRTQNEFNDPVFSFNYPAHWAYDGLGLAYKNIGLYLQNVNIHGGRILNPTVADSVLFSSGDEVIISGKQVLDTTACQPLPPSDKRATFTNSIKAWAVDTSFSRGGPKGFYFLDQKGKPYSGDTVTIKVTRSGRRNMGSSVGSITSLVNPIVKDSATHLYSIVLNQNTKLLSAAAQEIKQVWKVEDKKQNYTSIFCRDTIPQDCTGGASCTCTCLKQLFNYLLSSHRLFIRQSDNVTVAQLVTSANSAGFTLTINDCNILKNNASRLFYAISLDSIGTSYSAMIGTCTISLILSGSDNIYRLKSQTCGSAPFVTYYDTTHRTADTVLKSFYATITKQDIGSVTFKFPTYLNQCTGNFPKDIVAAHKKATNDTINCITFFKFDSIATIPSGTTLQSATLKLFADPLGFGNVQLGTYPNAHTTNLEDNNYNPNLILPDSDWTMTTDCDSLAKRTGTIFTSPVITTHFQDLSIDIKTAAQAWINTSINKGFLLSDKPSTGDTNPLRDSLHYATFCSEFATDSTKWPRIDLKYLPSGYVVDSIIAQLSVVTCQACDTFINNSCLSVVTDTVVNPYVAGILGNFRPNKAYSYYGQRTETDPTSATNIRANGTFGSFAPFWTFQSGLLKPVYDTTRWVWNSQVSLFNPKGLELENFDPLGRYNTGIYGYNEALPIAVVQNSQYREAAFEGFEDYGYNTAACDTTCPSVRHFDFSYYISKITTTQKHSGKSCLKLNGHDTIAITCALDSVIDDTAAATFTTTTGSCAANFVSMKVNKKILEPIFSPFQGRQMVVSAWVKEGQDCKCVGYTHNKMTLLFNDGGSTTINYTPTGNIIEGWQRIEGFFTIPATATTMTVRFLSLDTTTIYFDDLRILPFNGSMKSFVYNPVNLRLMAELDENNYTTFYEYDDDGTLIRVKKETERGIQTIKETRSALIK